MLPNLRVSGDILLILVYKLCILGSHYCKKINIRYKKKTFKINEYCEYTIKYENNTKNSTLCIFHFFFIKIIIFMLS